MALARKPADPLHAFAAHDHGNCSRDALARAEAITTAAGARLTPVRRRALEILLEDHRALGAYDVLNRLAGEGFGNQPPVAYRALEFLVAHGLAHRIQRLNAFTACTHIGNAHSPAFLICRSCSTVAEAAAGAIRTALDAAADEQGFVVEMSTIEALGLCPACRSAAA
ncbi:transcriptional repressor [Tabrizicola caldifontis]|uniref:transcriptional repressor n=1 Tax=Tabrizicola caldifontis TaxID=2528036 RepID=UPI0010811993|nr:transcriptional repressor [Rhodobacter sp. YIM 73028]